ncbi:M23 family metallopeptidase [Candidatus Endomicrobiellum trichonymphae]|uniref:M23 family metallopeptidase n=1 Tax=Endomicrobium trichonymphae TaxID=1408204 RepID=UPI0015578412|nr:M23 family metallopeptidase [Candidatus Endomicrobium trichonymphae]
MATDYAAPFGTPVSTVGDGIVKKVESTKQFGNLVVIKHPNNYETYYAHLSKYAKGIKEGVRVNQGEVIGYVGMTGFATGAHLDFRIKHNNNFFDFCKIEQPTITLTSEDKKEFKEKIQNLLDIFDDRLQNIECG